jgi:hypothetical protein
VTRYALLVLHSFPQDGAQKKQWVAHAQLLNKDIKPTDKLCSQHFLEKYIDRTGQITRLRSDDYLN